jgi:hypothetical protein
VSTLASSSANTDSFDDDGDINTVDDAVTGGVIVDEYVVG